MIQDTFKATMDMMRAITRTADIKVHRGFTDFLADRILRICTEQNLLKIVEKLIALLNSSTTFIDGEISSNFIAHAGKPEAKAVIEWLRQYSKIAAIIIMQRDDALYEGCVKDIEIKAIATEEGTALQGGNYQIPVEILLQAPLAHGAEQKAGNATLFRTCQVLSTNNTVLALPYYAGNALRGKMRDLLADHFLRSLGLTPRKDNPPCALWFFHALYAGGALEENSEQGKLLAKKLGDNGATKADGTYEFRDIIPMLSLLGSALGNRIISGRVCVGDLIPCCKEWGNGTIPVGELYEWTFLTRREDHENHADGDNSSMIANTQTLKAGTKLVGGIDPTGHITDLERSCLGLGLRLLQQNKYLGAESRRGFGRCEINYQGAADTKLYEDFLQSKKDEIIKYLTEINALNTTRNPMETIIKTSSYKKSKKEEPEKVENWEPPTPATEDLF